MITAGQLALLAGLGGLLALDRTAFLQSLASRPLVASTVGGYVAGDPALGLRCGCLLELLWLMELPVGAALPPDETLAALLAVPFALSAPSAWAPQARASLGILAAVPFAYLGRVLDRRVRRWNGTLLARARNAAAEGGSLSVLHVAGGAAFFLAGAVSTVAGAWVGSTVLHVAVPAFPPGVGGALALTGAGIALAGVAAVLSALRVKGAGALFSAGFVGGLALKLPFVPLRTASRGLWRP